VLPEPKRNPPPPADWFSVHEGIYAWKVQAHTHRQAALKYAERHYASLEDLKDELVLVVIRERDGLRHAALLRSKVLVQWTAPQVEEVRETTPVGPNTETQESRG
jgi:hypothetical protein